MTKRKNETDVAAKDKWLPKIIRGWVIKHDWEKGRPGSMTGCTLAVMVKRTVPSVTWAAFKQNGGTLTSGEYHYHYKVDNKGAEIIACTDQGLHGAPLPAMASKPIRVTFRLVDRKKIQSLTAEQRAAKVAREKGKVRVSKPASFRVRIAKILKTKSSEPAEKGTI